jgi:hypothetical protein
MLSRLQQVMWRICVSMAAICLVGGLMVSAGASTAYAGANLEWGADVEISDSSTAGGPAVEGAAGTCYEGEVPIPCIENGGWWNGQCYVTTTRYYPDNPNLPSNEWFERLGKTDGVMLRCVWPGLSGFMTLNPWWSETEDKPPSLEELSDAAYLLVKGSITAPDVGVFPGGLADGHPQASGLVGVPTWFWAENPGPGVGSPDTKTTMVDIHVLRATASFLRTVYDTGDGHTVTCGLGSAPVNIHRPTKSYSGCDHTYMERGTYTITATTYVEVTWKGAGKSGRMELSVDRTGEYRMGENQVVNVP